MGSGLIGGIDYESVMETDTTTAVVRCADAGEVGLVVGRALRRHYCPSGVEERWEVGALKLSRTW